MERISRVRGATSAHRLGTRGVGKPGRGTNVRTVMPQEVVSEEVVVPAPKKKKKKTSKKTTKKS